MTLRQKKNSWKYTKSTAITETRRRADSKSNALKNNMRKELSLKCTKGTKKNKTISFKTWIKLWNHSTTFGTKMRNKSATNSKRRKRKCWPGIRENSKKADSSLKSSSLQEWRKHQNCSIFEKWRSIWSNKKCEYLFI